MRHILLLLMLCLTAAAADSANSITTFAQKIRESYEKKDAEWMLSNSDTQGVPEEIVSAQKQLLKSFWGRGNLEVSSVEPFEFSGYEPFAAPGEFQGRELRFVGKPTHWVVLGAESPKPKPGEESASKIKTKMEFAAFQKDGRWWIAGATYAD